MSVKSMMIKKTKKLIKNRYIKRYLQMLKQIIKKYSRICKTKFQRIVYILKGMFCIRVMKWSPSKGKQLRQLFNKIKIEITDERFVHFLDPYKTVCIQNVPFGNISIDYSKVVDFSLKELLDRYSKEQQDEYVINEIELLKGIEELIDRIISKLEKDKQKNEKKIYYFKNMKDGKANSLEEALQRILFWNQLLWQTDHRLNGFGRLDKILQQSYQNDCNSNKIKQEEAKEMLKDFMNTAHQYYEYKSNVLLGDTGQIIILGGKEQDGTYFYNELTYLFIEALKELQLPDPKILLRVAKDTPRKLIQKATECVATGVGSPLFSNDEVVISKLIEIGIEERDAYNYITSACWEPLIAGKSFAQNNIRSLNFLQPFNEMLEKEELEQITNMEIVKEKYFTYLQQYVEQVIKDIDKIVWEEDPLLSLFIEDCLEKHKDIAKGGAKYSNYGVTGVAIANTANCILNIKEIVFEKKDYTLTQLNEARKKNFEDTTIQNKLKETSLKYGNDEEMVIQLVNEMTQFVNNLVGKYRNRFGGKLKFGLSAPSYITESANFPASLDGRKEKEPFEVHISASGNTPYTEVMQFASKLDYTGNRLNGNVVDFIVAPSFIKNNMEKFIDFLVLSIQLGFFQMQMNIISSEILIKAKAHPQDFKNLIVRVWGFSAYFNELPESYQDLLIERAIQSERAS